MQQKTSNPKTYSSYELDNGLAFKIIEEKYYPFVYTFALYGVGSYNDPPYKKGIAHFMEHLYFRIYLKNKTLDQYTFSKFGTSNAFTTPDYTLFYYRFPSKYQYEGISIESEKIKNFRLKDVDFFVERNIVLEEIKMYEDNPFEMLRNEFLLHFVEGEHPYKFPVIGYKKDILNIRERDIIDLYKNLYVPDNIKFVIGGKVDKNKIKKKIEENFSSVNGKKVEKNIISEPKTNPGYFEIKGKFKNTHILIGFKGPSFRDIEFDVISLFPYLFTDGKTSLFYELIENGLISSTSTIIEESKTENFFFFHFVLPSKRNLKKVLKKTETIFEKIDIEEKHLEGIKKKLIADHLIENEDLFNKCLRLSLCSYYEKDDNLIQNIEELNIKGFYKTLKKRIDISKMSVGVLVGKN